jgi:hypothetical protein
MPVMNGGELAEFAKHQNLQVKVILYSERIDCDEQAFLVCFAHSDLNYAFPQNLQTYLMLVLGSFFLSVRLAPGANLPLPCCCKLAIR